MLNIELEFLSSWKFFILLLKAIARVTDSYCPVSNCAKEALCLKADKGRTNHGGSCNGDSGGFLGTFEPKLIQYAVIHGGGPFVRYP